MIKGNWSTRKQNKIVNECHEYLYLLTTPSRWFYANTVWQALSTQQVFKQGQFIASQSCYTVSESNCTRYTVVLDFNRSPHLTTFKCHCFLHATDSCKLQKHRWTPLFIRDIKLKACILWILIQIIHMNGYEHVNKVNCKLSYLGWRHCWLVETFAQYT